MQAIDLAPHRDSLTLFYLRAQFCTALIADRGHAMSAQRDTAEGGAKNA